MRNTGRRNIMTILAGLIAGGALAIALPANADATPPPGALPIFTAPIAQWAPIATATTEQEKREMIRQFIDHHLQTTG